MFLTKMRIKANFLRSYLVQGLFSFENYTLAHTLRGYLGKLCFALCVLLSKSVFACDGAQNIQLTTPVEISSELLAEFQAMDPLKVMSADAPPMARFNEKTQTYQGIGADVLCFITKKLGLSFKIEAGRDQTLADKLQQVQEGSADLFMLLSYSEERAKHGLFTTPYYTGNYAVITRSGRNISIRNTNDLARYQVGFVDGVSLQPILESVVPPDQLLAYDQTTSDGLFEAVRNGDIDIAVFNKQIFIEKRYHQDFLDLEIIHTLYEHKRDYGYYFSQSHQHQRVVEAFDLYLAAIDVSASAMIHEVGERSFFDRYIEQRDQRVLLQIAIGVAVLLAFMAYIGLLRYRKVSKLLAERTIHLQQQQKELQDAYQQLKILSQTDSLTGLSNRRHFDAMLTHEYKRYQRTGLPLSLLIIDVDYFKSVNDHYGHAVGDKYLIDIANVLKASVVRSTDLIARYGGDEFACLLTDATPEDTYKVVERINQEIAKLNLPNVLANPPHLTLSIGVATVVQGDPGIQEIFAQADAQLYTAKEIGRNQIRTTVI